MTTSTTVRRALTVLVAAMSALATWALLTAVAHVDLVVEMGGAAERVTAVPVVSATIVAGLVGWTVLALLERFARHASRIWATGAGLILLVSLQPVLAPSSTSLEARLSLATLHAVVAIVVVVGMLRKPAAWAAPEATERRAPVDVPASRGD